MAPTEPKPDVRDVTHVFLDVGGTLVYSEPSATDIFHRALAARGHLLDRERVARLLRTPGTVVSLIRPLSAERAPDFYRGLNARIIEHLGLEPDDATLDEIHAHFSKPATWRPFPDAVRILKALRDAGYRIGVISNASHTLPEVLRKTGLTSYLDTITYSSDIGAEKPNVRIFRYALAAADATPERSVHVGDSFEEDYVGARQAGMHALLLCRESEPPEPCPHLRTLEGLTVLLGVGRSRD